MGNNAIRRFHSHSQVAGKRWQFVETNQQKINSPVANHG
jgi:hypothetical protein